MTLTISAIIPPNPSVQLQAALKWVEAVASHDTEALGSLIVDGYEHNLLPELAALPKFPNKEKFLEHIASLGPLFATFTIDIKDVIDAGTVVIVHIGCTGETKNGIPYLNENLAILYGAQQSDGVYRFTKSNEYVDTKLASTFMEALQKAA